MALKFFGAPAAVLVVAAVGCTQSSGPLSPTAAPGSLNAAADGSTLKADAPTLVSPTGGTRIDSVRPLLVVNHVNARFTATPAFGYLFEVYPIAGSSPVVQSSLLGAGVNGQTRFQVASDLELDTRYRWRARVEYQGRVGPWSAFAEFLTIDYRGIVPRPPGGNWPSNGPAVVAYIAASFPDRLRISSLETRIANMRFLRDRIVEAGICGGLDVAHNKKRGFQEHSVDAIAWRMPNGQVEVIDLASAYDDPSKPLQLKWAITDGPAGFDPYPNESQESHPGC